MLIVLTACVGSSGTTSEQPATTAFPAPAAVTQPPGTEAAPGKGTAPTTPPEPATPPSADCPVPSGIPWQEEETVTLEPIASDGEIEVYAAEYPLPGPTEGLWSQWGQGVVAADGRHFSAVGDHLGRDGNSWFFVYDPERRELTRFADVLSLVPHQQGAWGYGKVHAQMGLDGCGTVWATTYWGSRRNLRYGNGYEGDRLISIRPDGETIADHGPIAGRYGMPTLTIAPGGRMLVASGVDPEKEGGVLVVYDTISGEVRYLVDDPRQDGFRALAVDPDTGGVLYSVGDRRLAQLDPATGEIGEADLVLPGRVLRAATEPTPEGYWFGVSNDDPALFTVRDDRLETLGDPDGYTTSLAMAPDGERIFWLPDAHGGAWKEGAVIRAMDTATGGEAEVISLRRPFADRLGLLPGGTYSMVYDQGRLIVGVNASPLDDDSGFGTVIMVVIEGL